MDFILVEESLPSDIITGESSLSFSRFCLRLESCKTLFNWFSLLDDQAEEKTILANILDPSLVEGVALTGTGM